MMSRVCLFFWTSVLLLPGIARAQPAPETSANPKRDVQAMTTPVDPYLDSLVISMKGQRVIAVGTLSDTMVTPPSVETINREKALVGKLQVLSAAFSGISEALIPYAVRKTWVIAPSTREEVTTDLSKMTVLDAASRGLLLTHLLGQLTPEQADALGSDNGLPVSDLNDGLQGVVARALRPPLVVEDPFTMSGVNFARSFYPDSMRRIKARISSPLDLAQVRLRARLAIESVVISSGNSSLERGLPLETGPMLRESSAPPETGQPSLELPVLSEVPNTYKPSDLQGRSLTMPIGMSGIKTVAETVAALSKRTGLKLHSGSVFGPVRMFIGSPAIECGEVLDALRLALTASWRHVGQDYVLVWDRRGLGALQLTIAEQARRIIDPVRERNSETWYDEGWRSLATALPFDPADPFAPTAEQRKKLSRSQDASDPEAGVIRYAGMTPRQQDAARKIVTEPGQMPAFDTPDGPSPSRSLNESDLPNTSIYGAAKVIVSVFIPGTGWVSVSDAWGDGTSQHFRCYLAPRTREEDTPKPASDPVPAQAVELPAPTRGLMVPPMSPTRLASLAPMMKRHGLNTLFYPALFGGYATFPARSFPLHPVMGGSNGWKAAVQDMAPLGIKVVGYVGVLSWQAPENRAHWINKYPEWIDKDALGRTRLKWLDQNPNPARPPLFSSLAPGAGMMTAQPVAITSNYVRVSEPNVTRKLDSFIDEFVRQPGGSGIAFVDWQPYATDSQERTTPPPLGCAMPDRLRMIGDTGDDPIDDATAEWTFDPRLLQRLNGSSEERDGQGEALKSDDSEDPNVALTIRLSTRAMAARKEWKTWFLDDGGWLPEFRESPGTKRPPFDIRLQGLGYGRSDRYSGWIVPIWPRTAKIDPAPDEIDKGKAAMESYVDWWEAIELAGPKVKAIVLDMREAPMDLNDTLALIKAPSPAKPKPAAGTMGTARQRQP